MRMANERGGFVKLDQVVSDLKSYIQNNQEALPQELDEIILFGSYARGDQNIKSDIDIAIIADRSLGFKAKALVGEVLSGFCEYLEINIFSTTYDGVRRSERVLKKCNFEANKEIPVFTDFKEYW